MLPSFTAALARSSRSLRSLIFSTLFSRPSNDLRESGAQLALSDVTL
jgi:hypothetical protein